MSRRKYYGTGSRARLITGTENRKPRLISPFSAVTRRTCQVTTRRRGWPGKPPGAPEMKVGMIALTDCSSIVSTHEKGLFKKHGINSTVAKGASWAAIRDSL